MTEEAGAALRGHAFRWNQNLLWKQKEGNSVLRNMSDQGALSYQPTIFAENDAFQAEERGSSTTEVMTGVVKEAGPS